jgi:uncharacterized RDD family membrane protein YckC
MTEPTAGHGEEIPPTPPSDPYGTPPPGYGQAPPPPGYGQAPPPPGYGQAPPPPGYGQPPPPGYAYPSPVPAGWAAYPDVPPGMWYDQASGLVLPNGVELASVGRRIGAYFLAIPLALVTLFIGYIIWGLIIWDRGQTPALQLLGMRVWRPDQRQVAGWGTMALREIVGRIAEGILSFISALISFILFLSRKDHQSLHDLIASTVVLHDPNNVLAT